MIRSLLVLMLALGGACSAQTAAPPTPPSPNAAQPATPVQSPNAATPQPAPPARPETATAPPQGAPKPSGAPPDTSSQVPASAPVITVNGICSTPATKTAAGAAAKPVSASASCKTVVTKAAFDKLLKAANPTGQPIPPAMRRNLGQAYVTLLTFSEAAKKAGMEKDPDFLELMRVVRMQTLENFYRRKMEEKYRNPPAAEIQAYYNQNLPKYEEVKLSRIFVPAKNPASPGKDDWETKAKQVANDIHDRAAKGEDFEKLQKEAYTTLGLTIAPPSTSMGTRRRGMMAPNDEQELFALKPGDVSKLEQEPAGYIIYKVESKQTLPMEQVKDEISRELFRKKMDEQQKAVTAAVHADYNDQYFGPAGQPSRATGPRPPGAREPDERGPIRPSTVPPPAPTPSPAATPAAQPPK